MNECSIRISRTIKQHDDEQGHASLVFRVASPKLTVFVRSKRTLALVPIASLQGTQTKGKRPVSPGAFGSVELDVGRELHVQAVQLQPKGQRSIAQRAHLSSQIRTRVGKSMAALSPNRQSEKQRALERGQHGWRGAEFRPMCTPAFVFDATNAKTFCRLGHPPWTCLARYICAQVLGDESCRTCGARKPAPSCIPELQNLFALYGCVQIRKLLPWG